MFLTRDELEELTDYRMPAFQRRWLEDRGFSFEIGASGRPKVLRSHVEQRLGAGAKVASRTEPDFSSLLVVAGVKGQRKGERV